MQGVSSGRAAPLQVPATQLLPPHSLPEALQFWQAAPPLPHDVSRVPGVHTVPSQQPSQLLVGQTDPQPSSAPLHRPAQSGMQDCPASESGKMSASASTGASGRASTGAV